MSSWRLAAVKVFRRHSDEIDLVLMGMQMPKMSAAEGFDEIRQIRSGVRALLSSGLADEGVVERFDRQSLSGSARKPYRMADVKKAVRGAMVA